MDRARFAVQPAQHVDVRGGIERTPRSRVRALAVGSKMGLTWGASASRRRGMRSGPYFCAHLGLGCGAHLGGQLGQTVGVAPLVVVPAQYLDQVSFHHGELGVEETRGWGADDVG